MLAAQVEEQDLRLARGGKLEPRLGVDLDAVALGEQVPVERHLALDDLDPQTADALAEAACPSCGSKLMLADGASSRSAIDSIAAGVKRLANGGNANARIIVDELARRGVDLARNGG